MKKDLVIFDLDGTLALIEHRRPLVEGPPGERNWPAFFAACVDDAPNWPVIAAFLAHLAAGHEVLIVSGRSDEVRAQTEEWISKHVLKGCGQGWGPIMRPAGDFTPDDQLKLRWLNDGTIDRERVLCAYDDRDRVVEMWRGQGIACFQVAPGGF